MDTAELTAAPAQLQELAPPFQTTEILTPAQIASREMNRRNWELRRHKEAEGLPIGPIGRPADEPEIKPEVDPFIAARLLRVRAHLSRLDDQLEATKGAQDIERLSRAIAALSETERKLAGRPDPGSRRPGKERDSKDRGEAHPV